LAAVTNVGGSTIGRKHGGPSTYGTSSTTAAAAVVAAAAAATTAPSHRQSLPKLLRDGGGGEHALKRLNGLAQPTAVVLTRPVVVGTTNSRPPQ